MTSVWPSLWPPWKRTTMSACSDNQSTILPFPSSPHWAPTTTTLAISRIFPAILLVSARSNEKDVSVLPDHALACPAKITAGGRSHAGQHHRIKEAGYRRKQEGGFKAALEAIQPIDIPTKFVATARQRASRVKAWRVNPE